MGIPPIQVKNAKKDDHNYIDLSELDEETANTILYIHQNPPQGCGVYISARTSDDNGYFLTVSIQKKVRGRIYLVVPANIPKPQWEYTFHLGSDLKVTRRKSASKRIIDDSSKADSLRYDGLLRDEFGLVV